MTKLSIIVPIYNVEQYLRKCIDSLLNQDIPSSEYEIILVDDGGHDMCPQICDSYAETHKNIQVVHRENGGLSAARNSGIEVAQGEYIMFVDSDDYIEPNVLGGLLAQVEREELDVLRYNFQNVRILTDNDGMSRTNVLNEPHTLSDVEYEVFKPNKAQKRDVDYSETVTDGETFLNERLGPMCYAWAFMIRHCLIYNDGMSRDKSLNEPHALNDVCLFKEGIYFEDTDWTPRMLMRAKRVASTEKVIYNYLWRTGSITLPTDPQKRRKVIEDKIALIRGFKEQSKLVRDPKWFVWMTSGTVMSILGMISAMSSAERKPYIQELKSMQIFPLSTKKEKIMSHKIKTIMANISPSLYCNLMSLRK